MDYTNPNQEPIDFSFYLRILRRRIVFITIITIACFVVSFLVSSSLQSTYEATTILLVSENTNSQTNEYNAILTSERQARTYSQILTAGPVLEALKQKLGLPEDLSIIERNITVNLVPNTQLIEVEVQNVNPSQAALIANTLVSLFIEENVALQVSRFSESKQAIEAQIIEQQRFIDQVQDAIDSLSDTDENRAERTRLEQLLGQYRQSYTLLLQSYEDIRLAENQSTSNIVQIDPATPPKEPIGPKVMLNGILAGVAGLVLSASFVFLQEALDNSIKSTEDVKNKLGVPVLAMIGKNESKDSIVSIVEPRSPISEAFRSLRTNIKFASVDKPLKTIVITSAKQGEGKSMVAANLGFVVSQLGTETILIDADLRRPRLHKLFDVSNKKGLSNLFVNRDFGKTFSTQIQNTKYEHLKVISSGGIPPNPSELIASDRMVNILAQASETAGLVIVDAPPVLPVTDAVILSRQADGVLIVIVPGETTLQMAKQTIDALRQVNAKIIGVVFNNVDLNSGYFSSYKNGYHYLYDHES